MNKANLKSWFTIAVIRLYISLSAIVLFLLCPAETAFAGSIVTWGDNYYSQCNVPLPNTGFIAISAGELYSLGLKQDGTIVGWGYNVDGQASPPDGNDFVAIAAGGHHSLGLKANGYIVGWGSNWAGQATPPDGNDFMAISAGGYHSLGLKADGTIVGWGDNVSNQASPPSGNNYVKIAAGGFHSLALRSDGSIVGWGANYYGQATPPAGNNFIDISAGEWHSLALRSDGSIVGWGANNCGQATPPAGNKFIAIAAGSGAPIVDGGEHSLGLKQDGSIVAWGKNNHGQCNIPSLNTGFIAISAGNWHSLALRSGKQFMLTFDDGPVPGKMGLPGNTENIVNSLEKIYVDGKPVRAGFFMVGVGCCENSTCYCPLYDRWPPKGSVRANHGIVQMVAKAPARHYIGVHTQHHPYFNDWFKDWSVKEIMLEISQCYDEIKSALGLGPNEDLPKKIFRPPYFSLNTNVCTAANKLGFQIILGAGDERAAAVDVGGRQWTKARNQIRAWQRDEPCVLVFHDISPSTHENIAEIIEYLRKEGFTLVHFDPQRLPKEPDSVVHHSTNTIHQSETVPRTVSLDSTVSTATFNVSWEGSDLDLVLYKPDGTKIDSNSALADPNIKYAERDTYEYYTVSDPNPGNWIMEVSGVNVPPEGEKYTVRVEAEPIWHFLHSPTNRIMN